MLITAAPPPTAGQQWSSVYDELGVINLQTGCRGERIHGGSRHVIPAGQAELEIRTAMAVGSDIGQMKDMIGTRAETAITGIDTNSR